MLYLGPRFYTPASVLPSGAPARRARSNFYAIVQEMCDNPADQSQTTRITHNIADLPSYQFFPELCASFSNPELSFQRGVFQRIQAKKIDLPPPRPPPECNNATLWINRLPEHIKQIFTENSNSFTRTLAQHVKDAKKQQTLPHPRLYATNDEYAALLDKAEHAGMLHWTIVGDEDTEYCSLATDIEMTLFAVSKSEDRSRLISWPRVQNDALPQPPYTSLPNPALFDAIRVWGKTPGAFFLDVSNMFHNITLPLWLARLFPMKPIAFSSLPRPTQARISKRFPIPVDTAGLIVRPCQATMPMGFKWAVFIAHTFFSSCLEDSFRLLASTKLAVPRMKLSRLQAEDAPFYVQRRTPLLLHIIDDAAAVTFDWHPDLVTTWHRIIRNVLRTNRLPVSEKKSSHPSKVITDSIIFIGCEWNFTNGVISPSRDKLETVTTQSKAILESQMCAPKDWERITGKLLWFATLNRPLLACTQSIFQSGHPSPLSSHKDTSTPSSRRELRTLTALLPLARVDTHLSVCHIIVAFDASKLAGAVTYAYASPQLAQELWRAAQSARFARHREACEQLEEVTYAVRECHWKLAFIHYWQKSEHINCLEACTAVLSAEWLSRSRINSSRVVFLTDSLVSLGALQKGRSSKPGLLLRCRRFAALVLAHDLRVCFAFVRSAMNPADKYTRIKRNPDFAPSAHAEQVTQLHMDGQAPLTPLKPAESGFEPQLWP